MNDILCIYHGNCADGFTAAWAVRKALGSGVEFYPGVYQQQPPDVKGKHVVMVDFSYKRPVLEEISRQAASVLILDHHATAQDDLAGFEDLNKYAGTLDWDRHLRNVAMDDMENCAGRPYTLFDMERSGARLAWDFFHPGVTPPPALLHVEDRDLWRFAIPGTREVQANVFSYPYDFDVWDSLMAGDPARLIAEGAAIERKHHKDIAELVKVTTRMFCIGGVVVPVANLPYTLTSDAGHLLAADHPFAGCYWDTPAGRVFSLRSRDDGADVGKIAAQYGGGGHAHASGFTVPWDQLAMHGLAP